MTLQTSMSFNYDVAEAGHLFGHGPRDIVTAVNNSGANIPFGMGVVLASTPEYNGRKNVELPATANDVFAGIALHRHIEPNAGQTRNKITDQAGGTTVTWEDGDALPLLEFGKCYVNVDEAVTITDDVYLVFQTNDGGTIGHFRTDADSSTSAVQITNAKFASTTTGAGIAILEIN